MMIVGCDFHPSFQQVAVLDTESGELQAHKLLGHDAQLGLLRRSDGDQRGDP